MWYDSLEKSKDNMVYHFVKDGQGNVIGLMNYYDAEAWYSYDAWGNCKVLNPDGTVNTKAEFIGNINPIRWKSQYYDAESRMYYIGGRYYDPDIKRYVSPGEPEEAIANAGTVYGINPYLLCLTNPVNMVYNGYTIETDGELSYEPDELSEWKYFWKVTWRNFWNSKFGKGLAIGVFVAATVIAIVCPAFAPIYGQALLGVGLSLGVGGLIAGIRSHIQGNGFWDGFVNHISENWEQEVALSMIFALIMLGINKAAAAIKNSVGPKSIKNGSKAIKNLASDDMLQFRTRELLEDHFAKHGKDFKGLYQTADEYLAGANKVIQNGVYNPELNGYVEFYRISSKGKSLYHFVGITRDKPTFITTYYPKETIRR